MLHDMRSAIPVIIIGIILWTIALVVAIIANAMAKVILACVLGITLGFIGITYTKRRAKREGNYPSISCAIPRKTLATRAASVSLV